jgi:integrase
MRSQLAILRVFRRFFKNIDAVEHDLHERIILPSTTATDARNDLIAPDRAENVLAHLDWYRYATLEHALLEVLWHTGLRIGAAVGVDINDYSSDEGDLAVVHRPEQGTSLKNGSKVDESSRCLIAPVAVRTTDSIQPSGHR